jgi:hypothetical protein
MAIDPKARTVTLSYAGGTVTGVLGLIEYIFGAQQLRWTAPSLPPSTPGGPTRRKYGSRQRSSAAGGKTMTLRLSNGETWQLRYTGTAIKFIDAVLTKSVPGRVVQAWTPRGTIYGQQIGDLA